MVSILRSASCPSAKAVQSSSAQWALKQLTTQPPIAARHIVSAPALGRNHSTQKPLKSIVRSQQGTNSRGGLSSLNTSHNILSSSAPKSGVTLNPLAAAPGLRIEATFGRALSTSSHKPFFGWGSWALVGFVRVKSASARGQSRGFATQAAAQEFVIRGKEAFWRFKSFVTTRAGSSRAEAWAWIVPHFKPVLNLKFSKGLEPS